MDREQGKPVRKLEPTRRTVACSARATPSEATPGGKARTAQRFCQSAPFTIPANKPEISVRNYNPEMVFHNLWIVMRSPLVSLQ